MKILVVGDVTEYLSEAAKEISPDARLLDYSNLDSFVDGVWFTSLADIGSLDNFISTLGKANKIVYCPPEKWSDDCNGHSYQQTFTEYYCGFYINKKEVVGLPVPPLKAEMLKLVDERRSDNNQLWACGCSYTVGYGVDENERYGYLLGQKLGLPVSFLAKSGASIPWTADQILRSDIRPGDTLVWGLTGINRKTIMSNDGSLKTVTVNYYDQNRREMEDLFTFDYLTNETNNIYNHIRSIEQVIAFCNRNNVKLLLAGLLVNIETLPYLTQYDNFIQLFGVNGLELDQIFLDVGSDNEHAGPITHNWYAEEMYKALTK